MESDCGYQSWKEANPNISFATRECFYFGEINKKCTHEGGPYTDGLCPHQGWPPQVRCGFSPGGAAPTLPPSGSEPTACPSIPFSLRTQAKDASYQMIILVLADGRELRFTGPAELREEDEVVKIKYGSLRPFRLDCQEKI